MASSYNINDWYWIVGGDETKIYSSKIGDYVSPGDSVLAAWKLSGNAPTRIASEDELSDVLASASARPQNAALLDGYRGVQATKLSAENVAKIFFNFANQLLVLQGKPPMTNAVQFRAYIKAML